ncbi:uncharacterized protein MONBRDRAFT_12668 [Monosiga brevicollis MX1]|uniref:Nose resistant-to-fluoxetine protein N-terminal domain-containing protein n=1 Tax=Monosiga brevicollis TaxID=81824 RepID=A9VCY9_MONBE|nr:uncharacterized protein MONBRDRAFT_12668 [Monosiga brevicollis MX1]EDQ84551.1 predicted protein [Monosiga brevicollis MX1]|eukprot:XP_001750578.1 hypothetical protein [Monosiga brevicollis MX1]
MPSLYLLLLLLSLTRPLVCHAKVDLDLARQLMAPQLQAIANFLDAYDTARSTLQPAAPLPASSAGSAAPAAAARGPTQSPGPIIDKCIYDLNELFPRILPPGDQNFSHRNLTLNGLRMVDAWGKLPAGVLTSPPSIQMFGDYAECISLHPPSIPLQFCMVEGFEQVTPNETHVLAAETTQVASWGICLPRSCNEPSVKSLVDNATATYLPGLFSSTTVHCARSQHVTPGNASVFIVLGLLVALVAAGTGLHLWLTLRSRLWAPKLLLEENGYASPRADGTASNRYSWARASVSDDPNQVGDPSPYQRIVSPPSSQPSSSEPLSRDVLVDHPANAANAANAATRDHYASTNGPVNSTGPGLQTRRAAPLSNGHTGSNHSSMEEAPVTATVATPTAVDVGPNRLASNLALTRSLPGFRQKSLAAGPGAGRDLRLSPSTPRYELDLAAPPTPSEEAEDQSHIDGSSEHAPLLKRISFDGLTAASTPFQGITEPQPPAWQRCLLAFSLRTNLPRLLSMQRNRHSIAIFDGMRSLSMLWVILGHSWLWIFKQWPQNMVAVIALGDRLSFQAIAATSYAVDTFFFISGFLVCYSCLTVLKKRKTLPWLRYYLHRYIRLTPSYALVMLLFVNLSPFLGDGPVFYRQQESMSMDACEGLTRSSCGCAKYWWANFLYIQNYYPSSDPNNECMGWTWYLALDMQMYWASPLLLLILHRHKVWGMIVWSVALLASIVIPFALAYHYHLSANALPGVPGEHFTSRTDQGNIFSLIQNKPWTRMAPYLMGIMLAYHLTVRHNSYSPQLRLKPALHAAGWAVSAALLFIIIYCATGFQARLFDYNFSQFEDAVWISLCRPLWALVLCWITYTSAMNAAGWVSDLLAAPFWLPVSRLTFNAYLIHPVVLNTFFNNLRQPIYYQDGVAINFFIGNTVMSYAAAGLVALLVEIPFAELEKVFTSRKWRKP